MDIIDKKIVIYLLKNARISFRKISNKLKISPTTIGDRVRKMLEAGIIEGFYPKLNYAKLGFKLSLVVLWEFNIEYDSNTEKFIEDLANESYNPEKEQNAVVHYIWSGTISHFTNGMLCSAKSPEKFREWWNEKLKKYPTLIRHHEVVLILKSFPVKKTP